MYVCYISLADVHEWSWQRRLETLNECILCLVCYHFILFTIPSYVKEGLEESDQLLRIVMFCLIGGNTLFIMRASFLRFKRGRELKKMK